MTCIYKYIHFAKIIKIFKFCLQSLTQNKNMIYKRLHSTLIFATIQRYVKISIKFLLILHFSNKQLYNKILAVYFNFEIAKTATSKN